MVTKALTRPTKSDMSNSQFEAEGIDTTYTRIYTGNSRFEADSIDTTYKRIDTSNTQFEAQSIDMTYKRIYTGNSRFEAEGTDTTYTRIDITNSQFEAGRHRHNLHKNWHKQWRLHINPTVNKWDSVVKTCCGWRSQMMVLIEFRISSMNGITSPICTWTKWRRHLDEILMNVSHAMSCTPSCVSTHMHSMPCTQACVNDTAHRCLAG